MREFFVNKRCVFHISIPLLFVTLCIIFFSSTNVMADIPSEERDALIALYNSTNGDGWTDNTNWNGAAGTEGTWYGITVESDHVTQINLSDNHLDGTIPSELGDLTSLTTLSLAGNILEGSIPTSLTNLTGLTTLLIDYNALYTHNSSLQTFLDGINPAWDDHQTLAPENVSITDACFGTSATLTWTPVSYTGDTGGYEVRYGTTSGGLNSSEIVFDKSTSSTTISGLSPDTMYYFAVSSYTDAHPNNANDVFSGLSQEVSGGLCYDVTFSPDNASHGSITGDTSQTIEPGEDCTGVTAVPATGYHFTGWTGDYEGSTNPLTITNVTSDMTVTANFEIDTFTVNFNTNGSGGSLTGDTSQTINYGSDCTTVTAVPATGYHFTGWTGDYTSSDSSITITNVTSDMTVTANFEIDTFTVTFDTTGNGSITGSTSQTIDYGSDCTTVTAAPATGWHFVNWTGDYTSDSPSITVTNVTSDMTVTANFEINTYTVTFVEGANGSITGDLTQEVNYMDDCTQVTAVPATGYHFSEWSGSYTGSTNPLTIKNVTSDMTVTANFEIDTFTVTFDTIGSGSITGSTTQTIDYGDDCSTVTAVAATGWHFVNWTGDYTSDSPSITVTNVTSDMTVTANFEINTYTVTFVEGPNGTIDGNIEQTVNHGSNCTQVTAVPDTNYQFVNWSGDYTSSNSSITITNVTEDMTVTANFALDTYTVEFLISGSGSITGETTQTVEHGGSSTEVTAEPATGWHFVNWTGDYTSNDPTITIDNVTDDMTVTANFEIDTFTVNFNTSGSGGSLTGDTSQTINYGSDCTTVTAVPDTGYHFVDWTGDYTSQEPSITITNVTSDMTVTANFEIDTFTVDFLVNGEGSITGNTNQTIDYGSDCTTVTAVPATGWHFVNWTGDYTSEDPSITITSVTANMTVTANFEINTYTVTFVEGENGSIAGGDLIQTIDHGSNSAEMTAEPEEGYHFVDWTGDYTSENATITIENVTDDMTVTANFEINTYTVTFVEGDNGTIDGELIQTIEHGSDCTEVTAVPGEGYHFLDWTGDYTGDTPKIIITNVTADMTVTANFEINIYTVTFAAGENGRITGQLNQEIPHGGNCTQVEAFPNNGYNFKSWTGDHIGNANPLILTNVTSDMEITANFDKNIFSVVFNSSGNGSIGGVSYQEIPFEEDCTEVTATPDTGYHFVGWTGDYTSSNPSITITNVTSNLEITANFEINVYTVTFSPGDHGGLSGFLNQEIEHGGTSTAVNVYPEAGYDFVNWNGAPAEYKNDNPLIIENVTSDMTITANYVLAFDGNGDGTPDAAQDHVKNMTAINDETVTIEFPDSSTVLACDLVDDPSPDDRPIQYDFEYGFFTFTIDDVDIGGAATVVIYLPEGASPVTYFKYGPTTRTPTPHWYEFMFNGSTGAEIDGNKITLHFVDGERGDDDLSANGKIEDDGGPGFSDIITPQDDDGPIDSEGASGGCFIDAASSVSSLAPQRELAVVFCIGLFIGMICFGKTMIPQKQASHD